ncbi:hypothetical protein LINGRAHAP2_LOCUS639, partial [Linum grandiflorum]
MASIPIGGSLERCMSAAGTTTSHCHQMTVAAALAETGSRSRNLVFVWMMELKLWSAAEGLKYFDIEEGKGPAAQKGSTVLVRYLFCNFFNALFFKLLSFEFGGFLLGWLQVHFDCIYRGVTAVSSQKFLRR